MSVEYDTTSATVSWPQPTAFDASGVRVLRSNFSPHNSFDADSTTEVVYTANDHFNNTATCIFYITITKLPPPVCEADIYILPSNHILRFSATTINLGANTTFSCASSNATEISHEVYRFCVVGADGSATWSPPTYEPCSVARSENEVIDSLAEDEITANNVEQVTEILADVTENVTDYTEGISTALTNVIAVVSDTDEELPPAVVEEISENVFSTVDNVLDIPESTIPNSADEDASKATILSAVDTMLTVVQKSNPDKNFTYTGSNIAAAGVKVDQDAFPLSATIKPITSADAQDSNDAIDFAAKKDDPKEPPEGATTVSLPRSILNQVSGSDGNIPISVYFIKTADLFQPTQSSPSQQPPSATQDEVKKATVSAVVGSPVLSVTVEGANITNLDEEIAFTFPINKSLMNATSPGGQETGGTIIIPRCVFWDTTGSDGWAWSTEGCRTGEHVLCQSDSSVSCWCNHLTSFAVLLDFKGGVASETLDKLSQIGSSISIVCLVITIALLLGNRVTRKRLPQQLLVNLASALLGLYLTFVIGIDRICWGIGCHMVAILLHFFCLASVTWMGVEALNMYIMFVRVMNAYTPKLLVKCCLIGWGVPVVVVTVTASTSWREYVNPNYCFIKPGNVLYFGLLLPIAIILAFNVVMYILVVYKLTCGRKVVSKPGSLNKKASGGISRKETIRRAQNAIAIGALLGVTWTFGLVAIGDVRVFFNALFIIFNVLQGVFVCVLFGFRQPDIQKSLKDAHRRLWCGGGRRKSSSSMISTWRTPLARLRGRPSAVTLESYGPRSSTCSQSIEQSRTFTTDKRSKTTYDDSSTFQSTTY